MGTAEGRTAARERNPRDATTLWFISIVAVALVIRVAYLIQLQDDPLYKYPTMDARVHHEWATTFAAGGEWSVAAATGEPLPYFRAPLYVWFLGTIYKLFGEDSGFAPRLIQSLIGAMSCGLMFLLGKQLFGHWIGAAAGLAGAANWTLVYFDNELLIVPLVVFLDSALLLLLVYAARKRALKLWALAGLVTGLGAIARPNILLFAPFVCLWSVTLAYREGSRWKTGLLRCVIYGFCLLIPILPVTIRNYVVGNDTVLISSQGGVNFYIGNNPRSDGVTAVVPGTPRSWWGGYYATQARAARALGHVPKPSEVSRYFFDESLRFWREMPGKALSLTGLKARLYITRQEFANNRCIYTFTEEFTPIVRWLPVGMWIVGPLGLLGLLISLKSPLRMFPLWGFFSIYSISVIMFFINARYRLPVVPVLSVYSAFALSWLVDKARRRSGRGLLAAGVVLAVFFFLFFDLPRVGFGHLVKHEAQSYWGLTARLSEEGETDEAIRWADRTIAETRGVLERGNNTRQKERAMRFFLFSALREKGKLLEARGDYTASLDAYGEAIRWAPAFVLQQTGAEEKLASIPPQTGERQRLERYHSVVEEAYKLVRKDWIFRAGRLRSSLGDM